MRSSVTLFLTAVNKIGDPKWCKIGSNIIYNASPGLFTYGFRKGVLTDVSV